MPSYLKTAATAENIWLGLAEIFQPNCQIAVVARSPVPQIDTYLAGAIKAMANGFRLSLKSGESLPLSTLPFYPGREAFAADINQLIELFGDLLGCPMIGLRLEILIQAMCPRFHVDNTGIRLLCTYR